MPSSAKRTLVIDTATKACSVALFDGSACVASHHEVIGRGHAEKLVPFIANLPKNGRADHIAVNIGPGSFTGIRVGIAAAKALAFAWGVECHGYGCLRLIAAMAEADEPVDVVMNGGHSEYFFQSFDKEGIAVAEAQSMKPEMAMSLSAANIVTGDVADKFVETRGSGTAIFQLPDARFWHHIAHATALLPSPVYGRAPDAKAMPI